MVVDDNVSIRIDANHQRFHMILWESTACIEA